MKFPPWVDDPKEGDEKRAKARLTYIMNRTAVEILPAPSIRALSRTCGLDHSTLFWNLRRGRLSEAVAQKIVDACGTSADGKVRFTIEDLLNPLAIKSK
ncbi:MAG: hypothetical protein KDG50_06940 [Chromatiales bacterium]|nr:hypothetical protein [Chromatiales bacterium]